jgi:thioredoxin-dependent peroxiredoxin
MSAKEPLDVGQDAPAVEALNQDGELVSLEALYKEGDVLVYFYPRADTPGCTAQACSLRDDFEALTERKVTVVGVSTDDVAAQKAFQEKHQLPFTLLADTERKVVEEFGVPTRGAFATRQAFLIRQGKIVWRDLEASTAEQAADVLKALASLDG